MMSEIDTPQLTATKTVADSLKEGIDYLNRKDIDFPRIEAEHLLSATLACRRMDLYLEPQQFVSPEQSNAFWNGLTRRGENEPLQYITGVVTFEDFSLAVQPGVFIPRPETELIVEEARKLSRKPRHILDLCTGSGALAIALAKIFPAAQLVATDLSAKALSIAQFNINTHKCNDRITLLQGDLFEALQGNRFAKPLFDLIVCNPPYIPESDRRTLPPEVRDHEPEMALFAPEQGTAFYRRILRAAPAFLAEGGSLVFELGVGQAEWFRLFIKKETDFSVAMIQDWAGIDRIAHCVLQSEQQRMEKLSHG